jgi:hypothetical protein
MLGFDVAESTAGTVAARRRRQSSQKVGRPSYVITLPESPSLDLFVPRMISFALLYGLVTLRYAHGRLVTIAASANPTIQWIAGQVTEASPWDESPSDLRREHDGAFGPAYTLRIPKIEIRVKIIGFEEGAQIDIKTETDAADRGRRRNG